LPIDAFEIAADGMIRVLTSPPKQANGKNQGGAVSLNDFIEKRRL
jgi:hypothetical protein